AGRALRAGRRPRGARRADAGAQRDRRALLQAAHAGGALLRLRCTVAPHPGPARADRLAAGARRSLLQPLRAGLPPPRRGPPHRRAGRLGLTSRGSYQWWWPIRTDVSGRTCLMWRSVLESTSGGVVYPDGRATHGWSETVDRSEHERGAVARRTGGAAGARTLRAR